ncbi:TonB-dependent receptor [Lusitaniella coriacea LEGE 07157]|uniref:TonB-dependent receptor n=1 Tax=Lusitaniella coriacea LEGE 07157 TaxID=945747 RepID=A0A8J7J4Y3_9CYAN|nr:TonB-dependent receptor [Lusitaniella coriacea]MBE9117709.1 TonB-dependent receptor [Lusitaniella coriacea LEGE 07157]
MSNSKKWQLHQVLYLTATISAITAESVRADISQVSIDTSTSQIPRLSEMEFPKTRAEWLSQDLPPTQVETEEVIEITGVRLTPTTDGIEVVLETAGGERVTPTTEVVGDALIAEIPNAVLALPDGKVFEELNPAPGIELVRVTSLPGERVQISITGIDAPPTAQVRMEAGNLVLSVVQEEAEGIPEIELFVTATRTAEEEEDIPRSVTVIDREEIEEQTNLTTNLPDILGQTVPGLGPPTQNFRDFPQTLRGRRVQVLIDGVPVSTNQNTGAASVLRSISPSAIERIEVVRGPSAAFGEGGTGGLINVITRRPSKDELISTVEARITSRGDLVADSFGNYLEYGLSGTSGIVDYVFNFSTEEIGFAFDGAGDRIPGEGNFIENSRNFNVLGKLGVNIGENQRLQVSVNHFDEDSEAEFINDPNVDDDPNADKARALAVDLNCIGVECGDGRQYTSLSLNYSHDSIFGSQLRLQGFYRRNYNLFGVPFEDSTSGNFLLGQQESERFGGRLEVETPFSETFNLLWGADYSNEESSQLYQILDDEFVTSGFRVARLDKEVFWTPPYKIENLGLFAQAKWDISPRWLVSGGVRYENIGVSVDNYTASLFLNEPIDVEGGSINADDVVFNIGTVYDLTDELSVFANFAQGFGIPDFGRLIRRPPSGFRSIANDLEFTAPQKVDNYELGFRGQWDSVQFSLAGFYNYSDFGVSFVQLTNPPRIDIARGPRRIYGVEATVDWQPSPTWQLGGLISWNEGEDDQDEDGNFDALGTRDIQPLKITAYVENETLPGWRNRLQALFVGGRNRGFESGADFVKIESYFVLDYMSSIKLGPGTVQIGIQNLLDEEYFTIGNQLFAPFSLTNRRAAPGRTISIGYRVEF